MNDRLKNAFEAVRAEEALKEKTSEFLLRKTRGYGAKRRPFRRLVPIIACCLLVLVLSLGAGWAYFTPVSAITIDINPSLELSINRFDRVLSVKGYNEDGRALASAVNVTFLSYEEALRQILDSADIQEHLRRDEPLSIVVVSPDQQQSDKMLDTVKHCAQGHHNVHCHAGNSEEAAAAQAVGLSTGKYRAFLELQALDPSVTPEEIQGLTMREIRDRIAAFSEKQEPVSSSPAETSSPQATDNESSTASVSSSCEQEASHSQGQGNGMGQGQGGMGHGQGNGTGHGQGHGKGQHRGRNAS